MLTKMSHIRTFSDSKVFRQKSFYDENFRFQILQSFLRSDRISLLSSKTVFTRRPNGSASCDREQCVLKGNSVRHQKRLKNLKSKILVIKIFLTWILMNKKCPDTDRLDTISDEFIWNSYLSTLKKYFRVIVLTSPETDPPFYLFDWDFVLIGTLLPVHDTRHPHYLL